MVGRYCITFAPFGQFPCASKKTRFGSFLSWLIAFYFLVQHHAAAHGRHTQHGPQHPHRQASVTRAYGEMTIGLLVTAAVAILTQATGAYIALIQSLGVIGAWAPFVVEIVIAIYLGARIEKIKPSTARVMFYVYAAIMGFSLSTIFMAYDLGTIGISLALCAGFFFALTMLGMTTKVNMLKAGPILLVGLIVLIVAEVLLMIFAPGQTMLMVISAIGLVLFAGMTVYDAQATRALFAQYAGQGEDMVKKVSIICALNLYLDFINMFLYILQLFGDRD